MSTIPCRSTIHCANWGFCHRCAPNLSQLQTALLKSVHRLPIYDERLRQAGMRKIQESLNTIIAWTKTDIPQVHVPDQE